MCQVEERKESYFHPITTPRYDTGELKSQVWDSMTLANPIFSFVCLVLVLFGQGPSPGLSLVACLLKAATYEFLNLSENISILNHDVL